MNGCHVHDDGLPGRCGLYLDEHRLYPDTHEWIHPDDERDDE